MFSVLLYPHFLKKVRVYCCYKPKMVEEAVDRIQFYQNCLQFRTPLSKHEMVRAVALEDDQAKCTEEGKDIY